KWAPLVGATVISTHTWNSLPEGLRAQMLQSARDIGARLREQVRPMDAQAIETMVGHKLTVHPVSPDVVAAWEKGASDCLPRIVGRTVPAATVEEVERIRDASRAAHPSP